MVPCQSCGKSIDVENPECKIHPEEHDYLIKTVLLCRAMSKRLKNLAEERGTKERRA